MFYVIWSDHNTRLKVETFKEIDFVESWVTRKMDDDNSFPNGFQYKVIRGSEVELVPTEVKTVYRVVK
jgi:hypothetical protein